MNNSQKLQHFCNEAKKEGLKNLFVNNPQRAQEFSIELEDLFFDFSKTHLTPDIITEFIAVANEINLSAKIKAMFNGEKINFTEKRAVLHTALRDENKEVIVDGKDYKDDIQNTLEAFTNFAEDVREGRKTGITNKKFKHIVNIGIGGSSLPVQMAYHALTPYKHEDIEVKFVSNVDFNNLKEALKEVNPETTMFLIASKTFTTSETMLNANTAKKWLVAKLGEEAVAKHFVALSTNLKEVEGFGIKKDYTFGFWDFIGGRYSLWSSIGLSLAIAIGKDNFLRMLKGAKTADDSLKNQDLKTNIPFIMAIITIMYRNFFNYVTEAVIPYSYYLQYFPNYLQQVSMESNGKKVNSKGKIVISKTAPALLGGVGTDAQHSFFQMLHQGADIIPVDFIGIAKQNTLKCSPELQKSHNDVLISNLIAQAEAFMVGKTEQQVIDELKAQNYAKEEIKYLAPHKVFMGDRPSNIFFIKELTPYNLGLLCALYEHKYFIEGVLWDINSYDQWGVELGKKLASNVLKEIKDKQVGEHDSSTKSLINYYLKNRE